MSANASSSIDNRFVKLNKIVDLTMHKPGLMVFDLHSNEGPWFSRKKREDD